MICFYQWWQIIEQNAALFTTNSQWGWVVINEGMVGGDYEWPKVKQPVK